MFEWKDEYSVQVGSIDAQHRTLFQIGAELHGAMLSGQGRVITNRILDRLVQYTAMHFAHEERLMRLNNYPDLAAHQVLHKALTDKVLKFQAEVQGGRAAVTVQLLQFLTDWLQNHIRNTDQKYVPFMAGKLVA